MKKILMLLFMVVLLSGCSANVNIYVTPGGIEENIAITAYSDSTTSKQQVYSSYRKYMPAFVTTPLSDTEPDVQQSGVKYYSRTEKDLGSGYMFNYNYKFKLEEYKNSQTVALGFDSKTIQRDTVDKNIMISTDSSGLNFFELYPSLETVTVNINSSYKVKESNADFVNGTTYSWVFRPGTKKGIYIVFDDPNGASSTTTPGESGNSDDKGVKVERVNEEEKEENPIIAFINEYPILVGLLAILVFIILLLIISKVTVIKN